MHPVLFGTVRAYPAFLVVAVLAGVAVTLYAARRAGVPVGRFARVHLLIVLAGVAGSKVDSLIERGGAVQSLEWELTRGYRYPGGLIGAGLMIPVVGLALAPPLSLGAIGDLVAPGVAASMATMRVGCFLTGCCAGGVCTLPWAVRFPRDTEAWDHQAAQGLVPAGADRTLPVHPLQLYFLLLSLMVAAGVLRLGRRKSYDGQVLLVFLAVHEGGKFLLEFVRDQRVLHLQLLSLALALGAATVLAAQARRRAVAAIRARE